MKAKLTKTLIDSLKPADKDIIVWDSETPGFAVKVTPKGKRSFLAYYRIGMQQRRPLVGVYGRMTVEEARREARRILSAADQGQDVSLERQKARKVQTLQEFAQHYIDNYAKRHKKPRSVKDDEWYLSKYIKPALGKMRVNAIHRGDVLRLQESIAEKPITANRVLSCLSKMMNVAELMGLRKDASNPCRLVKRFRETARRRFLSPEEMIRLARALKDHEEKRLVPQASIDFFRVALFTGMRSGEIRGLRWEDYDPANKTLHLRDSKTGPKDVVLSEAAIEVLDRIERHPSGWVIPGRKRGEPLTNPAKPWKTICDAAKLADFNIHDMRHVYGGTAAGLGLGLPIIGALMGHTVPQTTARYANLQNDPLHAAAELIGKTIKAMMEMDGAEIVDATPGAREEAKEAGKGA
ncbi:MAG: site-specific integrase [Candidatus Sumerlaeota bacterium]|nr:site-specific integrase [Candidatus Sumerlaeota bacterium]